MIHFEKLRWRNFLSTGDAWTEINLKQTSKTLVVGHNGSGKSTMLDALSFALFGKAHRNVNKGQLVNSINNKATAVEVEFSSLGSAYKVVRGIKPTKFEIYKNDTLLNQDSHAKEYQKVLEQNILKLNHKTFHQVVVLGSSSFIPFMQLSAQARREVIEDLLDINVFSKMNMLMRERNSVLKSDAQHAVSMYQAAEMKRNTQIDFVAKVERMNKEAVESKEDEIRVCENAIAEFETKKVELRDPSEAEAKLAKARASLAEVEKFDYQFAAKQKELNKELQFYEENTVCPTCDQGISEGLKQDKKQALAKQWDKFEEGRQQASAKISGLKQDVAELDADLETIRQWHNHNRQLDARISDQKSQIARIRLAVERMQNETGDLDAALGDLERLKVEEEAARKSKAELSEQAMYHTAITEMLKDTGIKTKIIKQYVPVINQLTNKYLQTLDFFVSFTLDDTFKESIRSRHRDEFSYESFSEGEKQRIDLALLFTWRHIAKLKNSVATNLLLLDETFDSSLDVEGVENLMTILDTLDDQSNVFVISHKGDLLEQAFERKLTFVKEKNFSKIA